MFSKIGVAPHTVLILSVLPLGCRGPLPAISEPAFEQEQATLDGEQTARLRDFDALWQFVAEEYAFLPQKVADWNAIGERFRSLAIHAGSKREFLHVLERTLDQLYDGHSMFNTISGA